MRIAWEDWLAQQRAERVERAALALDTLAGRYIELYGHTIPQADGGVAGSAAAGPRVPMRVDVVDVIGAVDQFVLEVAPLVWGALRAGIYTPRGTRQQAVVRALDYFAQNLAGVYAQDPHLGRQIAGRGHRLAYRSGVVLGVEDVERVLRVACDECGLESLWWHPGLGEVRCGNPDCGARWNVLESVLVHTSG